MPAYLYTRQNEKNPTDDERHLLYKQKGRVQRDGMDLNKESNPFPPDRDQIHNLSCVSKMKIKQKQKQNKNKTKRNSKQ